MQEDERDLLDVVIFDEIEETVGTWLRTIIQSLEKVAGGDSKGSLQAANPKRRNGANQFTTVRSIVTAAGADRHAVTFWFSTLHNASVAAATGSPDPRT